MKKKLLVLGASSGIGSLVVEEALARDYPVRAFARSANQMEDRENLEAFQGDALVRSDVSKALDGIDAVIYALGIKEGPSMLCKEVTLFSRSTSILLDEMRVKGVRRLLAVTGYGAGRSKHAMNPLERLGHRIVLGKPYEDKDRQEELIKRSECDWTIVRPVTLTNGGKAARIHVLTHHSDWRNGLVSRLDVAHYLLNAINAPDAVGAEVVITR